MEGAVWHHDGCELSSAISVLTQHSSRTSEVQVYLSLNIDVWGTIARTKENCYDQQCLQIWKKLAVSQVIALTRVRKRSNHSNSSCVY